MGSDEMGSTSAGGRAGTAVVLGTMTAVALFAVLTVTLLPRAGTGPAEADQSASTGEVVPTTLAGGYEPGKVPAAVSDAVDVPVVGVRELAEPPDGLPIQDCARMMGGNQDAEPEVESVVATPDGVSMLLTITGQAAEEMVGADSAKITCRATPLEGGGWEIDGNSTTSMDGAGGMSFSCCGPKGVGAATASAAVPNGAKWALHDRGAYVLAYPAAGEQFMSFSWPYAQRAGMDEPPASRVIWVDPRGQELGTEILGGSL